ncbi:MAG: hypothetical protein ABIJ31_08860 [Pseudomonadota bacterium]
MKLSVPYIPDKDYTLFLKNRIQSIESVYFPLASGPILDARMRFKKTSAQDLSTGLSMLGTIKKYGLLNSRFIHPKLYHDVDFLDSLLDMFTTLTAQAGMTGFVFSDAYFLTALSARKNKIIHHLEAVPGINCMIDSFQKAFSFFEIIQETGFKLPGKIVLDRSLNREFLQLETTCKAIKKKYSTIKFELLANEGCVYHCPYKLAHDSQISFSNTGQAGDLTFIANHTIGCHTYFFHHPERFFKSPFIRPEDTNAYQFLIDTIKLCGRTLGTGFLTRCIDAYIQQTHGGNLLELMDATHWLSDLFDIDNKKLDPGFLNMVTHCTKDCENCSLCRALFLKTTKKKLPAIKEYKEYQ